MRWEYGNTCNFKIAKTEEMDLEEMELEFIDHGIEEIFEDGENVMLYGPFESFGAIQGALEAQGHEVLSSGFERIPQVMKTINTDQQADVNKLLEKIEDDDDVLNVFHNMSEWPLPPKGRVDVQWTYKRANPKGLKQNYNK